jgi:small subunit ribosomal protein S20
VANSAQARKRARQADAQRAHNTTLRSALRTAIKKVRAAIAAGNKADAQAAFTTSVSVIDRIADKAEAMAAEKRKRDAKAGATA